LSLYLHVAGDMTGSWKILLGSWKSPKIYFGQDSGNPCTLHLHTISIN